MSIKGYDCSLCGRERYYKTQQGADKGKDKYCLSCTNSIKAGGGGWTPLCIDCKTNPRDPKYNSQCKECHNKRSKKYYKETGRWSKYGLTGPIDMEQCEICDSKDDLVIDHCHDSEVVRGVLCRTCNMAIGLLKENKNTIRRTLEYAERTFTR